MVGVVTERDEEWLRWMVRWKGVTARQVARWFVPDAVGGRQAVERRFRVWRGLELVEGQRVMAGPGAGGGARGDMTNMFRQDNT